MKPVNAYAFILCLLLLVANCQNVDLPTDDDTTQEQVDNSQTLIANAITVTELIDKYDADSLDGTSGETVVGYIVGTCKSSISNAFFTAETIALADVSSNMLIADDKDETSSDNCVPVELEYGSDFRADANLIDNPDNLSRRICLYGYAEKYFSVVGLKNIQYYQWLDDDESTTDADDSDSDDTNSDSDDTNDDTIIDNTDTEDANTDDTEDDNIIDNTDADNDANSEDDNTDTLTLDTTHVVITNGRPAPLTHK